MGRQQKRNTPKAPLAVRMRHRINAGRVAVREQVAFFANQFGRVASEWKADDTRVTFADFAISERIFQTLRRDFAEDSFCSEEAAPGDECFALESPFTWIIDPIDGTDNYARGFPCCAISLALLYEGKPIYGYIYDHSLARLLEGGAGYGLLSNQSKIQRMTAEGGGSCGVLGLHFPLRPTELEGLQSILTQFRVRSFGSVSLSLALAATGYLDAVYDTRGKIWDIAAGVALLEGAGCTVHYPSGSPFPLQAFNVASPAQPILAGNETVCNQIATALAR